jgi:hypothetical protein
LIGPGVDTSFLLGQVKLFHGYFWAETEKIGQSFVLVEDMIWKLMNYS